MATKHARLRDHFDASLIEIEVRQKAERDRRTDRERGNRDGPEKHTHRKRR